MINQRKYRTKKFAKTFIETNGNATQSYKAISPNTTDLSARVNAHRMLTRDNTQQEIRKLLPKDDDETNIIKDAYSTARADKISWSELHTYLETSLKLKGYLKDKEQGNTNIAIVIEK